MSANSWYRRSLFMYKGNREYTRTGYEAAAARFVEKDLDVDCTERQYMITGSNSGIGLQATLEVARRGGVIHMVCRNEEAAKKARSEVITTTGNDKIHLHVVDLSRPREVVVWAQRFAAQHEKLHVLIHNAGCMLHERQVDEDGVECNFAVNTLAVHILTLIMMPLLERSEEPRVVMVSSAGLLCVRLDPIDLMHASLDPFIGNLVYSQNKRQQVVMTLWYAQRYNKVHFASMHPGWADTPAVRTSMPQFFETMKDNLRSPSQGADTVVWLAISKAALKHPSGLFFQDREPVSTHFPLAWTKTSIEEEDLLMNNIQTVYTQIHSKIFSDGATPLSTPHSAPTTSTPHSAPTTSTPETAPQNTTGDKNENTSEQKTEESDTTQHPVPVETGPVTFPVLRPPPPPAERATYVKAEMQEVAEIHAPPPSSQLKEEESRNTKPSPSPTVERKTDATVDEDTNLTRDKEEERKTDATPDEDTNSTHEKNEERKTDATPDEDTNLIPDIKEARTDATPDNEEERKTDATPDNKEEQKTDSTPEDTNSTPNKEERKTESHHDANEDSSSTSSTERVMPEP